ncbi:MAG: hypothetical protein ACKO38_21380 [Planctomycetota bacterium]
MEGVAVMATTVMATTVMATGLKATAITTAMAAAELHGLGTSRRSRESSNVGWTSGPRNRRTTMRTAFWFAFSSNRHVLARLTLDC